MTERNPVVVLVSTSLVLMEQHLEDGGKFLFMSNYNSLFTSAAMCHMSGLYVGLSKRGFINKLMYNRD